jgi:hypothetical protein
MPALAHKAEIATLARDIFEKITNDRTQLASFEYGFIELHIGWCDAHTIIEVLVYGKQSSGREPLIGVAHVLDAGELMRIFDSIICTVDMVRNLGAMFDGRDPFATSLTA